MDKKLLDDYVAAWNSRDAKQVIAFFADGVVYEDRALSKVMEGDDVEEFIATTFSNSPDIRFELVSACGNEKCISWEWRMIRTSRFTGKLIDTPGMSVTELENGKVIRNRDYWSTLPTVA